MHKKTIGKIQKVLNYLKTVERSNIRGIARNTNLHPQTVLRIVDNYLFYFVDIQEIELGDFKIKMVSLKPDKMNATIQDVLNYYEVKKKIRG